MTRRPVYPADSKALRGAGVIQPSINGAIRGTMPGDPSKGLDEEMHGKRIEPARQWQLNRTRRRDYKPGATPRVTVHQAPVAKPEVVVKASGPAEMPAVTEWDNPFVKGRFTKAESRHRRAVREARIRAASDPANPVIRSEIIKRDRSTCWICETVLPKSKVQIDHVVPIAHGGKHVPENVRVACRSCNEWKADRVITPIR